MADEGVEIPGTKMKLPIWALVVGGVGIIGFAIYQGSKGSSTTAAPATTASNADLVSNFDTLAQQLKDYIDQIQAQVTNTNPTPPVVPPIQRPPPQPIGPPVPVLPPDTNPTSNPSGPPPDWPGPGPGPVAGPPIQAPPNQPPPGVIIIPNPEVPPAVM